MGGVAHDEHARRLVGDLFQATTGKIGKTVEDDRRLLNLFKAVGNLIDRWDGLPNDLRSQINDEAPVFTAAVQQLIRAIIED
jgi:hypothetical protein